MKRTLAVALLVAGCRPGSASRPPETAFSGGAAMQVLETVLPWPRAPGDPQRGRSVEKLRALMERSGLSGVHAVGHTAFDPRTEAYVQLQNLVGWVRPDARRVFVLATHFDTPPQAHEDPDEARRQQPVAGANDGTSGVAVILALTPLLADQLPRDVGFAVVLFDGEELGRPGDESAYCAGSRHVSQRMRRGQLRELARAEFGVVLDMVGDRDLALPQDPSSLRFHPKLVEHVWGTATKLGVEAFDDRPGPAVLDDHVYLTRGGVPSILIIDYDFERWHTTGDDLKAVSAESLGAVGEVLRRALLSWFAR